MAPKRKYADEQLWLFQSLIDVGVTVAFAGKATGIALPSAGRYAANHRKGLSRDVSHIDASIQLIPNTAAGADVEPVVDSVEPVVEPVVASESSGVESETAGDVSVLASCLESHERILREHSTLLAGIGKTLTGVLDTQKAMLEHLSSGIRLAPASDVASPNGKPTPSKASSTNGTGTSSRTSTAAPRGPSLNFFEEDEDFDYEELTADELELAAGVAERALAGDSADEILDGFADKSLTKSMLSRILRSAEYQHMKTDLADQREFGLL